MMQKETKDKHDKENKIIDNVTTIQETEQNEH